MIPTFGPRAGGTKVVFVGGFLGRENSSVSVRTWVGDVPFKVEYMYVTPDRSCHHHSKLIQKTILNPISINGHTIDSHSF